MFTSLYSSPPNLLPLYVSLGWGLLCGLLLSSSHLFIAHAASSVRPAMITPLETVIFHNIIFPHFPTIWHIFFSLSFHEGKNFCLSCSCFNPNNWDIGAQYIVTHLTNDIPTRTAILGCSPTPISFHD